jgi:transposase-like protein
MTSLTDPIFTNEDAARAHFEGIRWPDGRICPHCGVVDNSHLMTGKSTRPGLYKCRDCRKPFTATLGTIYERSHIPLHKWLLATQLIVASKKGMSAKQLERMLGFGSYRTAWFMAHRIREAMKPTNDDPMGSDGGAVEADETYIGRKKGKDAARAGNAHKMAVLSLVERNTGAVRSFTIENTRADEIHPILRANIAREARLMTDEARMYWVIGKEFSDHGRTLHGLGRYVDRNDPSIHSNTIEGYFSIFKRGMRGIYQHCGQHYLDRYLTEFDFRYTLREANGFNDTDRARIAIQGVVGKRLTYQQPHQRAA